jgi:DAACS family dicarboxylate/amino acid:cation (Na+ or H+) symporter
MLVGLAVGLVLRGGGALVPAVEPALQGLVKHVLDPLGQVFLRMLFFVVVPLVFSSLALVVLQLGRSSQLGPLAGRTFLLFALNMVIATVLGLLLMNIVNPGRFVSPLAKRALFQQFTAQGMDLANRAAHQPSMSPASLVEMFMPRNLLGAVADFQVLPLILFAILVGLAATHLPEARRRQVQSGLETVSELMTWLVSFAMRLAPWAVSALLASLVLKLGWQWLQALAVFVGCVLVGLAVHLFGTMSLLLRLFSRRSPREFFRAISPILVTAFSTSSSNATLPAALQLTRERLGVTPSVAGFVLPLGATMNMSGTALYEGCVVLFVAQVYGVGLGLGAQITLVVMAVLSAVAVAGIPGGSLPLIAALLTSFGIPVEGIAIVLGVDRLLDMARTTLNVGADVVTACIVDEMTHPPEHPPV